MFGLPCLNSLQRKLIVGTQDSLVNHTEYGTNSCARANSMHFGNVPFFAFIEVERWQIANVYVKTNKAAGLARKKGIDAAKLLVNEKVISERKS